MSPLSCLYGKHEATADLSPKSCSGLVIGFVDDEKYVKPVRTPRRDVKVFLRGHEVIRGIGRIKHQSYVNLYAAGGGNKCFI